MQRPGRLESRTALITGGSRGIGAAIAKAFAAEGCDIAFCHVDDDAGSAGVLREIAAAGRRGFAWRCDIGDVSAVHALFIAAERALGRVDIVVNNAGICDQALVEDTTMESLERMLAVHLRATFLLAQLAYVGMKKRGWGRIVNVTSQLAYKGAPGLAHYSAAKAGVVGFTRAFSQEAAPHGVLVNAIAPGPVDTRLNDTLTPEWKAWKIAQLPLGRFGRPDEIAPTAVLLASADGDFYVGQTLSPNGGDVML
jgi:3-oxoacyl-[acyl-carrier protein] reductase